MLELDPYWDSGVKIRSYCARPRGHANAHGIDPGPGLCSHTRDRSEGEPVGVYCHLEHGYEGAHDYPPSGDSR